MHLALLIFAALHAPKAQPNANRFAATIEEGQHIASNVQAVISATNALLALPHDQKTNVFFAVEKREQWVVVFGLLANKKLEPVYVLAAPKNHLEQMKPVPASLAGTSAQLTAYARAVVSSQQAAAKASNNPLANPVLMVHHDGLEVYELQGGAPEGEVYVGGDFLDRFDLQGKFKSRTQFHRAVITLGDKDPAHPDAQLAGSYHSHSIAEEPTATDVATVLLHPQIAPMLVVGRSGNAYRVSREGEITVEEKPQLPPDVPSGDSPSANANAADAGASTSSKPSDAGAPATSGDAGAAK